MEKQVGKKVTEEVCSISSCLYNSLNMTRLILDRWRVNKDNKFTIAEFEYLQLVTLISSGKKHDNWNGSDEPKKMEQEIANARYLYRDFLFKLVNTCKNKNETLDDKRVYIAVDGEEVGYVVNDKIMGVNYPRCRYQPTVVHQPTHLLPITLNDDVYEQIVDSTNKKNVIHLNSEWFFNGTLGEKLTPFQAYLACKAGDALVNLWLDMLVALGCDRNTELVIHTGTSMYHFLYTQVYNDWSEKILNVNHYELYPKMQFLEYEVS